MSKGTNRDARKATKKGANAAFGYGEPVKKATPATKKALAKIERPAAMKEK